MKRLFKTVALLVLPVLAGCTAVYSPEPLGDTVVKLDAAQWQGTWLHPEMVVITTVLDGEKGMLQAAWIERNAEGASLKVAEGQIRASGDVLFGNIKDDNDQEELRFLWLRMDKSSSHVIVWLPRQEQFEAMVSDGRLPGELTDDGVVLGKLNEQHLKMINSPASNLMDWEKPAVFIRVGD